MSGISAISLCGAATAAKNSTAFAVGVLAESGLSPADAHRAFLVVVGHVRIVAQFSQDAGTEPRNITGAEWTLVTRELLQGHAERCPALNAALADPADPDAAPLEFGLACVFDGVAALIARRAASTT